MQQTIHNIYGFSEEYQVFFQQRFDDLFDILEIEDKLFISLFQFNYHITKYTNKNQVDIFLLLQIVICFFLNITIIKRLTIQNIDSQQSQLPSLQKTLCPTKKKYPNLSTNLSMRY